MQVLDIEAQARENSGTSSSKALRKEGRIPGVIYSTRTNVLFSVHPNDVKSLVYTPDFKLAQISVGGQQYKCILKDLQFHPVTDNIVHMDFQEVVEDKYINTQVPIRLTGTAKGQKAGGILVQEMRRLSMKVMPKNMVDHVSINISHMDFGDTVRVRDVELPETGLLLQDGSIPICTVVAPRSLRSAASKKAAEEAAGTTEEAES